MNTVVILIEEGVIQEVISDTEAKVIIVDRDVEGCDKEDIKTVMGDDAYVYTGTTETRVDVEMVNQVVKEAAPVVRFSVMPMRCIDNRTYEDCLTVGKVYPVGTYPVGDGDTMHTLFDDDGDRLQTLLNLFEDADHYDGLPEECFGVVAGTEELVLLKRGQMGYCPQRSENAPWDADVCDEVNEARGVTKAQRAAMEQGSLFGWQFPLANPEYYDENGNFNVKFKEELKS
jgi:hypothetical protein